MVPLNDPSVAALRAWLADGRPRMADPALGDVVFFNRAGSQLSPRDVRRSNVSVSSPIMSNKNKFFDESKYRKWSMWQL